MSILLFLLIIVLRSTYSGITCLVTLLGIFIDDVFFSIHIGKEKHWILGHLNFKDRCIYIYNSLRCAKTNKVVMEVLESYSILLPVFFQLLNLWTERKNIDINSEVYASNKLLLLLKLSRLMIFLPKRINEFFFFILVSFYYFFIILICFQFFQ